jgi:excisionase family DNA binding protein
MAPTSIAPPLLLSLRETARLLSVSLPAIHKWLKSGAIPSVRIQGRRLIERTALNELIAKGRR